MLFDIGMEYDVIFSPLFASSEEWESGLFKEFPIYGEISAGRGGGMTRQVITDYRPMVQFDTDQVREVIREKQRVHRCNEGFERHDLEVAF